MKKLSLLFFLVLTFLSALLSTGCGGGGGIGLPPLPVFVPDSVTETDRTAAIDNISAFYGTVAGQPDAAAQVVARMKTLPQFAAAEISESGEAIGWFKDGVLYAVITSDKFRPTTNKAQKPPRTNKDVPKTGREIPGAPTAYLVNPKEEAWGDIRPIIKPILNLRGYDTTLLAGTIDDFAQIQDAGLLYLHATGCVTRDRNGVTRSWFVTADQVTIQSRAKYQAQIQAGTIAIVSNRGYLGPGGDFIIENRFCVSDKYLRECGMSFAPNAVWINEASYGASNEMFALLSDFPNLELYGSWSGTAYGEETQETSDLLFDRMLGENAIEPVDPEDPPLTSTEMLGIMIVTNRPGLGIGYDRSAAPGGQSSLFRFLARGNKKRTLIPSIRSVEIDSDKNEMSILGHFGSVPGAVTLDGGTMQFKSGTEDKIIVEKPSANAGSIVVTGLGGGSASGFLKSTTYKWKGLAVSISPSSVSLEKNATQLFSVSATVGTIPPGAKYKWTVSGAGKINNATQVTTTSPSATYKAPNQNTSDSIKVEVLSSSNAVLATAFASVIVGDGLITFTIPAGQGFPEQVGTHAYNDGSGDLFTAQNKDFYEMFYNVDANQDARVFLEIVVPVGATFSPGQEIVQAGTNTNPTQFGFNVAVARFLDQPLGGNSLFEMQSASGSGTLTINTVSTAGGKTSISFTYFTKTAGGGFISYGSGSCTFTRSN